MEFRLLNADEIDCRVQSVKDNGLVLLLYKDARCDMKILDETLGSEYWQREHYSEKNTLFCRVGIWNKELLQWIWKSDAGKESNTEAVKGESSDSFKRACFNWGIGRELYTAPFTWIKAKDCNIKEGTKCYDKFVVTDINYDSNNKITMLVIYNMSKKCEAFRMGKAVVNPQNKEQEKLKKQKIGKKELEVLEGMIIDTESDPILVKKNYNIKEFSDMTLEQYYDCIRLMQKKIDGKK